MTPRVMGIEIEYAAAMVGRSGSAPSFQVAAAALMRIACDRLKHLSDSGGGIFLTNGARLYLDTGHHPEICTPEVDHPDDCVRYMLACESILAELARKLSRPLLKTGVLLFKCNVDYWRPGVTWACHESYLHRANLSALPSELIAHLVSRVWCGAGGLNPLCAGIQFSLCPRAHIFVEAVSHSTTSCRGIFNTRDESLASGRYRRLHVICCDSLCSQTGLWLRLGTTCLVLAMAEGGLRPGEAVQLREPVEALHRFAADPYFRAAAELADGRRMTALQIQRHYLQLAEANVSHECMPPWAPEVCRRWRAMLDRLGQGPEAVERTLDWAIKLPVFMDHLREGGIDPQTLPHWNQVLDQLDRALRRIKRRTPPHPHPRLTADLILAANSPLHNEVKEHEPYLEAHGLKWAQVGDLLRMRAELCEIDIRFGQVEPKGIFAALEPDLDHRVPEVGGVGGVAEATSSPPATTRARLRGKNVQRLAGRKGAAAGWTFVKDGKGRKLDLSHPFGRGARWLNMKSAANPPDILRLRAEVSRLYNRGDYERTFMLVRRAPPSRRALDPTGLDHFLPYLAWVEVRRGHLDRAIAALNDLAELLGHAESLVAEYVAVYRFQALIPSRTEIWQWIRRADEILANGARARSTHACFLGHKGYVLSRAGSPEQAEDVLRRAVEFRNLSGNQSRIEARNLADLADVLRMRGRRDEAARWLDQAEAIYAGHDFAGERADYLLTYRAKLQRDPARARALLRSAKSIQTRLGNRIGLARTLLLEARLATMKVTANRRRKAVLEIRQQVPDLRRCSLLSRILDRWSDWAGGWRAAEPVTEHGDLFWLL